MVCEQLTQLLKDPEFKSDVQRATQLAAAAAPALVASDVPSIPEFLDKFQKFENEVLKAAGVLEPARKVVIEEISRRDASPNQTMDLFDRFAEKIEFLAKIACPETQEGLSAEDQISRGERAIESAKGMALISADSAATAGAAAIFGPVGAAVVIGILGISIGFGAERVRKAINGFW